MKRKEWIPYGIALIALVVGAFYDYQITDALYAPHSIIGMIYERFILLPLIFVVTISMCMEARVHHSRWQLVIAFGSSMYMVYDGLHRYIATSLFTLGLMVLLASILTLLTYYIISKLPYRIMQQYHRFFLFYTCVFLTSVLITSIAKMAWGRIRYRQMQQVSEFCVWYRPCLRFGATSFPSGHTTSFSVILCFLQWRRAPYQKVGGLRYVIIGALILSMPLTRMIMGAHFLSDTAMGFMVTYSCYLFYRTRFFRGGTLC